MNITFDIVIRNADILDGSGTAAYRADLGISDQRIAAIAPALSLQGYSA